MRKKGTMKRIPVLFALFAFGLLLSACSAKEAGRKAVQKGLDATGKLSDSVSDLVEKQNAKNEEKVRQVLAEKASVYGIDAEGVKVSQGGGYLKVPIDTIRTYQDVKDRIAIHRKWLRFGYAELGKSYYIGFFDREHPEIIYGGASNQDYGYPSEFYWNDMYVINAYLSWITLHTIENNTIKNVTPEEFYEVTGIDYDAAREMEHLLNTEYPSGKRPEIDKYEHTYAFIPGDTINHYEKFVIGDKDCEIAPGTYSVDLPDVRGVIHITDQDGNFKYRLDSYYKDGHTDELYEYSKVPAEVSLAKGDIIYMTNCLATFDEIGD